MNYRHAFHAGNFADVHKHWILGLLLDRLAAKDKPFFVLDSHAGAGFYDLAREETNRTGEAAHGIARLLEAESLPVELHAYREAIRRLNPGGGLQWYPGSPWLVADALRPSDRLTAIEAHPEQANLLRETLADFPNAKSYLRDGYEAIPSLLPPKERRGLTLIDPPYESRDEVSRIVKAVTDGMRRFATGSVMIWYPVKGHEIGDSLVSRLPQAERGRLRCELWIRNPASVESGLNGSGVILLNPIWPVENSITAGHDALTALLAQSDGAGSRIESF